MRSAEQLAIPNTRAFVECRSYSFCTWCSAIVPGKIRVCHWCGSPDMEEFRVYWTARKALARRRSVAHSPN